MKKKFGLQHRRAYIYIVIKDGETLSRRLYVCKIISPPSFCILVFEKKKHKNKK